MSRADRYARLGWELLLALIWLCFIGWMVFGQGRP